MVLFVLFFRFPTALDRFDDLCLVPLSKRFVLHPFALRSFRISYDEVECHHGCRDRLYGCHCIGAGSLASCCHSLWAPCEEMGSLLVLEVPYKTHLEKPIE